MKLNAELLDKVWVASDFHGYHKNISAGTTEWTIDQRQLASGNVLGVRDFDNEVDMTRQLITNINSIVPKDGILFHLGDWTFGGKEKVQMFRDQLNVDTIHTILGNHDHWIQRGEFNHLFTSINNYLELTIGKLTFVLFHFKISSWNGINRGWYQLHGHQHWTGDLRFGNGRQMDVGVDGNDLKPYKLTDVIELLKDRRFHDENDHHAK